MFLWHWLLDAVSWILVQFWHQLFSLIWGEDSGWSWTFAIVGLVVVIRILLIPLFVQADPGTAQHAGHPAAAQGDPDEVRRGPRAPVPGDDDALQGDGHQPAGLVPADPRAGADLLRPVPGPLLGHRQRAADRCLRVAAVPATCWPPATTPQIFGVPLYATFAHAAETPNPTQHQDPRGRPDHPDVGRPASSPSGSCCSRTRRATTRSLSR